MLFGQTSCDKSPEDDKYLSKVFPGCAQWLATDDTRYKLGLIKIISRNYYECFVHSDYRYNICPGTEGDARAIHWCEFVVVWLWHTLLKWMLISGFSENNKLIRRYAVPSAVDRRIPKTKLTCIFFSPFPARKNPLISRIENNGLYEWRPPQCAAYAIVAHRHPQLPLPSLCTVKQQQQQIEIGRINSI